ncbi:MAG: tRNA1(Val) (adenine(37)-N6)-methyltransferase [Pikeienuella sp.]
MKFAPADLTLDAFLNGRVMLHQPRVGYRAATDPVLLAAATEAQAGQKVLDVGCGAGTAALCLAARVPGLELHGLEMQAEYAALAQSNAPDMTVWAGDLFDAPPDLKEIGFDWVITNPPFFESAATAAPNDGRDKARREAAGADLWVSAALRRVRSGGRIAVIHLAEQLPHILAGLKGAGDIAVLPLQSRIGRAAKRVIVTARKGAKGPFRLAPAFVLHEGERHLRDEVDFSIEAQAVLRDGEPLRF